MVDGFNDDINLARLQLDEIDKQVVSVLPDAAYAACEILLPAAMALAPRRSGELAASGKIVAGESSDILASAMVSFTAFYAGFQEFGTGHHAANPFLRPAAENNRRAMFEEIKGIVDSATNAALLTYKSRKRSGG